MYTYEKGISKYESLSSGMNGIYILSHILYSNLGKIHLRVYENM